MKVRCTEQKTELEVERLTLVYKGRILKDEQTAAELKLADGQTIHLVNKPAAGKKPDTKPAASSASIPAASPLGGAPLNPMGGMGGFGGFPSMMSGGGLSGMGGMNLDPNMISSMMQNPMVQNMMNQMM